MLAYIDNEWCQVHDGYPSTHIVKPESRDYPTVIFDEEYGARIARAVGVSEYTSELHHFTGVTGLVIERYDRALNAPQGRIHQEDMNQVLGAHGNEKYQEHGGKVSLRRIAEVFRKNGEYAHSRITASDIVEEAMAWEMRNPARVVAETLETVAAFIETEEPDPRAYEDLNTEIGTFTRNLLAGKSTAVV